MKQANRFALAFTALTAIIALNEIGTLAQTAAMPGPGVLSSPTVGLTPDSLGAFPYLTTDGWQLTKSRFSADISLGTSRHASYGPRSTWLSRYLGSNCYRPRFDAQDFIRKGTRVRLVVTPAPQTVCYRTPTFSPFGGYPNWGAQTTLSCPPVTGYSIALLEAFAALDYDAKKLVRKSMARSDDSEFEWAVVAMERNRPTSGHKFVVASDSEPDGQEIDQNSF